MYFMTVVGDKSFFFKNFIHAHGQHVGTITQCMPAIPNSHKLIALMEFEIDIMICTEIAKDVSLKEDYDYCYERYALSKSGIKSTAELYLIKQSDIAKCKVTYIEPN